MMNPPIPAEAISMDSQPPVPYRATGPRTAAGKAIVARNAVSHGIFAANPVVPGLDRAEEWEAHRATLLASLAPEDDFQLALAERAALLFWRLRRVACYETETTAAALEAVEDDVPRHHQGSAGYLGVGGRPQDFRDRVAECRRTFQLLHDLPALPAGQPLSGDDVEALLVAALDEQEEDVSPEQFAYPGIPKDLDVAAFDGWTVALARDALRVIA